MTSQAPNTQNSLLSKVILELKHLEVCRPQVTRPIISELSLSLNSGEIIAVLGESGAGKSTLLRVIAGLIPITDGEVWLHGSQVTSKNKLIPPEMRNLGVMSQNAPLFPHLNVWENIIFGTELHKTQKDQSSYLALKNDLNELLKLLEIEEFKERAPQTLSGGQQRRVALARTLARNVDLYLLDEPLSHLDPSLRARIAKRMITRLQAQKASLIWISHERSLALRHADRVLVLHQGQCVAFDTPRQLLEEPPTKPVADLLEVIAWNPLSTWIKATQHSLGISLNLSWDLGFHIAHWHVASRQDESPHLTSLEFVLSQLQCSINTEQHDYGRNYFKHQPAFPISIQVSIESIEYTAGPTLVHFKPILKNKVFSSHQESLILSAYLSTYAGLVQGEVLLLVYTGPLFIYHMR